MLRPTKHTNLRASTIYMGAVVLHVIRTKGLASLADIEATVRERCGDVGLRRIQETILFLYVVGALDYAVDSDAFILHVREEAA